MARFLPFCLLLWSFPAAALELPAVAPTLAQDLLSGLRAAGSTPSVIMVQPFVGPANTAGSLDSRLRDTFHSQLGLQVISPAKASTNPNVIMADAAKQGAQAAIMGSLTCETSACTATGEAYDVVSHQLAIVVTVQFDVPKEGPHRRPTESAAAAASLRDLTARLAADLQTAASQFGFRRFAIVPMAETGSSASRSGAFGRALAEELTGLLQRDYRMTFVPAAEVAAALSGTHITTADLNAGQATGPMASLGAQAFIIGTIDSQGGNSAISLQLVSTANGEALAHQGAMLATTDLITLSNEEPPPDAMGAFKRSLVLPGWGQFYLHEPVKGTLFAVVEAAMIAGLVYYQIAGVQAENHYVGITDPTQANMINHYYGIAKNDFDWRNAFIGLAIGTHVINALDALIFQPKPDENL